MKERKYEHCYRRFEVGVGQAMMKAAVGGILLLAILAYITSTPELYVLSGGAGIAFLVVLFMKDKEGKRGRK